MNHRFIEMLVTILALGVSIAVTIFAYSYKIVPLEILGVLISATLVLAIIVEFTSLIDYGHQVYHWAKPMMRRI